MGTRFNLAYIAELDGCSLLFEMTQYISIPNPHFSLKWLHPKEKVDEENFLKIDLFILNFILDP